MGVEHRDESSSIHPNLSNLARGKSDAEPEKHDSTYLTIKDASELSGYDDNWIWRLASTGKIRYHTEVVEEVFTRKIKRIVINLDDLIKWQSEKNGHHSE